MEVPRDQMALLLENGLHESAQMLGCFLSASVTNPEASAYARAESLVLQGDASFGQKEFRRALSLYKLALQHCKIAPKQTMSNSRNSISTSSRSCSPNSMNISSINENEVKYKITLCHCALNENRAALVEMEGIPSKVRNLRMNLTMGRLYRISRHYRAAVLCYKECLRNCPYVLEAIITLAELGVSSKDILTLFPQTPVRGGRPPSDPMDSSRWLHKKQDGTTTVTRIRLYLAGHTSKKKKNGMEMETENEDDPEIVEIQRMIENDPSSVFKDIDHDPVALVCGRDTREQV